MLINPSQNTDHQNDEFQQLRDFVIGCMQLIVETFTFLQYSQIEIHRGFSRIHSKLSKEFWNLQWVIGFLVRRLLIRIHSLLYKGPEIEIPIIATNLLENTGIKNRSQSQEPRKKFKTKANFNKLPKCFISLIELQKISSFISNKSCEKSLICQDFLISADSTKQAQMFMHVQAIQKLQDPLIQQLAASSSLLQIILCK